MRILLLAALGLALSSAADLPGIEAIRSQAELDRVLTALDKALFDSYNSCDLAKFRTYFTDDTEFYHDQGGVTLGLEKLAASLKNNICGKDVVRELV
ncbi:MAG TPA: DUF4440 domain-containing protein, partial [Bryobacteraceae bacterium]|nr:DUF4440 domain-containing protein [Bryobacteraceae bacterium]